MECNYQDVLNNYEINTWKKIFGKRQNTRGNPNPAISQGKTHQLFSFLMHDYDRKWFQDVVLYSTARILLMNIYYQGADDDPFLIGQAHAMP